jgi:hypothetical protein
MNSVSRSSKFLLLSLIALIATPLIAAQPARRRPSPEPFPITVTGTVTDAATAQPVAAVEVTVVNSGAKAITDANGKYTLAAIGGYPVAIAASRTGYNTSTQTINAKGDATLNFVLSATATTSVRETNGNVTQLDTESFKFAYLVPFSGYISSDKASFCLADGSASKPDRSEIAKIIGPAVAQTGTKCCNIGPVLSVQVVLKNGQQMTAYLTDSCFGNEVDVLGRVHATGQFAYFNLANVAEVDLP